MTRSIERLSGGLSATVEVYHRYMDELLVLHQEALFERDIELAGAFWRLHRGMLRVHIEVEEERLVAALQRHVSEPAWRGGIYLAEHRKLLSIDDGLYRDLCSLEPDRRSIIGMLDKQRTYKNMLEHHHEREEKGLLPELEANLSGDQKREIVHACQAAWGSLKATQIRQLDGLRARLPAN